MLSNLDAFRRPERFELYLQVCEADARGRRGLENRDYPQSNYLREALLAAENIDTATIAAVAKEQNRDIAAEIRNARITALKSFMQSVKADNND